MILTDSQRADLTLLREADAEYQDAREKRERYIRYAVEAGIPFDAIGRSLGITGRAVGRLAVRRGWHEPREYARRA
jgi:hypothetical protein